MERITFGNFGDRHKTQVNPKTKKGDRVGIRLSYDGKAIELIFKSSGEAVDI